MGQLKSLMISKFHSGLTNIPETDVVISDFESDLWHDNADYGPIILAGREGYQGVHRLCGNTCFYACLQTWLNEARTIKHRSVPNYGRFE